MIDNFIILGSSRAGKTKLSNKLAKTQSVSWVCGDAHVETLQNIFPETGVKMHGDPLKIAHLMEHYFSELVYNYNYEGGGCVLDTVHLHPQNVEKIRLKHGYIPCVYLAYTDITAQEKLKLIRRHDTEEGFWSTKLGDDKLLEHITNHQRHALEMKIECEKYNIAFFETGRDYELQIESAYNYLVK